MKRYFFLVLSSYLLLLLAGCDKNVYYAAERDVDERGWNMNDAVTFDVPIDDTLDVYNFFFDLRNSVNYDKANAFFFISTTFPDGSTAYDTLECPLANVQGQWLGRRTGRYVDNRYYFRKHVIFPRTGTYTVTVAHGMRDTNVVGLKSVGIRVERVSAK